MGICSRMPRGAGAIAVGPRSPGSITELNIGSVSWSNLNNALTENGVFASVVLPGAQTNGLIASNFGFTIDGGKTIQGIRAGIKKRETSGANCLEFLVGLTKDAGANLVGDNKNDFVNFWPAVAAYVNYGGPSDLWNTTWTPAEINDPGFGIAIVPFGTDTFIAEIDHVRITVFTD